MAAWRERVAAAGLAWPAALPCIAAGDSGATLIRPALERGRAVLAARAVARVSLHAPDRFARP